MAFFIENSIVHSRLRKLKKASAGYFPRWLFLYAFKPLVQKARNQRGIQF